MENDLPSAELIKQRRQQGLSYVEAIDNELEEDIFNKHANFKMKTVMSKGTDQNKETTTNNNSDTEEKDFKDLPPEEINKDNFQWRTGEKDFSLDEMDLDLKLSAYSHALKKANDNFAKRNHHRKKAEIFHNNVKYFMRLCDILEDSLLEDHNLPQVPSELDDVKAMQRLIRDGIITVDNFNKD